MSSEVSSEVSSEGPAKKHRRKEKLAVLERDPEESFVITGAKIVKEKPVVKPVENVVKPVDKRENYEHVHLHGMGSDEVKRFMEWRDASTAKCAICSSEVSRSHFGPHLQQFHKMDLGDYKSSHGPITQVHRCFA